MKTLKNIGIGVLIFVIGGLILSLLTGTGSLFDNDKDDDKAETTVSDEFVDTVFSGKISGTWIAKATLDLAVLYGEYGDDVKHDISFTSNGKEYCGLMSNGVGELRYYYSETEYDVAFATSWFYGFDTIEFTDTQTISEDGYELISLVYDKVVVPSTTAADIPSVEEPNVQIDPIESDTLETDVPEVPETTERETEIQIDPVIPDGPGAE